MDPDRPRTNHWWNDLAIAGGLIAAAGILLNYVAGIPMGLGLLLFGVGEWLNHPRPPPQVRGAVVVGLHRGTGNPWKPRAHGILLDVVGIGLFGVGILLAFGMPLVR
jgi:hypothetical protein